MGRGEYDCTFALVYFLSHNCASFAQQNKYQLNLRIGYLITQINIQKMIMIR